MTWYQQMTDISHSVISKLSNIELYSNSAIVFDIDNTLLHLNGTPIIPIIHIFNFAKSIGLTLVIITNRLGIPPNINFTTMQLENSGIYGYRFIYFRSPTKVDNPWRYKEISRKHVLDKGFNIIMSIGDQEWDIGNYSGEGIKVPVLT